MGFFDLCLRRPVGVGLLMFALLTSGALAFHFLPLASLPRVDYPTIVVSAALPGADPKTMAATVAAPLERRELCQAFLGTQGDDWDAQKDITLAIVGAAIALSACALYRSRSGREPWLWLRGSS